MSKVFFVLEQTMSDVTSEDDWETEAEWETDAGGEEEEEKEEEEEEEEEADDDDVTLRETAIVKVSNFFSE